MNILTWLAEILAWGEDWLYWGSDVGGHYCVTVTVAIRGATVSTAIRSAEITITECEHA